MLVLHRSNRVERLVDRLAEWVRKPLASPFAAEVIGVPSRGMERWLTLELARRFGVSANSRFPYPRALVEELYDAVLGPVAGPRSPSPLALTFAVARAFRELAAEPVLSPVTDYLRGEAGGQKLLQLAQRVGLGFERLMLQRPDMLVAWSAGEDVYVHPVPGRVLGATGHPLLGDDQRWQPAVWRHLEQHLGAVLLPARRIAFTQALARGKVVAQLPERLAVFGAVALPVALLEAVRGVAQAGLSEVALFVPTPTRDYLGNVARSDLDATVDEGSLHPLLVSMGRLLGGFQQVQEELGGFDERDDFDETFAPTALGELQRDLLLGPTAAHGSTVNHAVTSPGAAPATAPHATPSAITPRTPDDSLVLHDCQGALREVEALHDALLEALESDPTLEPRNLVVMCPQLDRFAPLIDAVFGHADEPMRLPYQIADRSPRLAEPAHEAFFAALALLGGRFTAAEFCDLLRAAPVAEKLGLAAESVESIDEWLAEAGFAWALDAQDRAALGAAPLAEHTLRFALDRLLVGLAMRPVELSTWRGVAPVEAARGVSAQALEQVVMATELLTALRTEARVPATPAVWGERLERLVGGLFDPAGDFSSSVVALREAILSLVDTAGEVGFDAPLELTQLETLLAGELGEARGGGSFLSRGITFCAMLPLRAIPFRVVALLGLSDGAFPRQERPTSFDLLAAHPAPGDRSLRADDLHLFLEAILSARERLIVTYSGHDPRQPGELPPSVVVSALADAQARLGRPAWTVKRHARKPWSVAEFDDSRGLHGFSRARAKAATQLAGPRAEPPRFVTAPLDDSTRAASERAGATPELALDEVVRALTDATTYFVTKGVGLARPRREEAGELDIPLDLDHLTRSQLGRDWLGASRRLGAIEDGTLERWARATGALPPGEPGVIAARLVEGEARRIAAELARAEGGTAPARHPFALELDGVRLVGELAGVCGETLIVTRVGQLRAKHELGAWIQLVVGAHLGLCSRVVLVGLAPTKELVGVATPDGGRRAVRQSLAHANVQLDTKQLLGRLIELTQLARTQPLPFFVEPAQEYANALEGGNDETAALAKAVGAFGFWDAAGDEPSWGGNKSVDEPLVRRLYAGLDPLAPGFRLGPTCTAPDFPTLARELMLPLVRARKEAEA